VAPTAPRTLVLHSECSCGHAERSGGVYPAPVHELVATATAWVSLTLLVASTVAAVRSPGPWRLLAFAALGLWWLEADTPVEVAVVLTVSPGHGVALADLLLPAAACPVLVSWLRRVRGSGHA
jgi:hypothetical protein